MASVPPASAARSHMPDKPNAIGLRAAACGLKPAPLSETRSLTLLSVVLSERFTWEAREYLRMFCKLSCATR